MTRIVSSLVAGLLFAVPLLVLTACRGGDHALPPPPPPPPAEHDDETVIAAVQTQLKAARSNGWSADDERIFSGRLAQLSMPTRMELGRQLAREITFGQIVLRPTPPPPDILPPCPCCAAPCAGAGRQPPTLRAKGAAAARPQPK